MAQYIPLATMALPLIQAAPGIVRDFSSATGGIWETFQKMTTNAPKARYEELQKCKEATEEEHKKAVQSMEGLHRDMQRTMEEQEKAADRRIKEQKEENEASLESLRAKIQENEDKYEKEIQRSNDEHAKKMKEFRSETKEVREKAEKEHEKKMGTLQKEHKEEKSKAQEKLETTKKEGELKIKNAEGEKEAIRKERTNALAVYNKEMAELTRLNQEKLSLFHKEITNMQIGNFQERRKQLEEENKQVVAQLESETKNLVSNLSLETNKSVVTEFNRLRGPFEAIHRSLIAVQNTCLPAYEGQKVSVEKGVLDDDFEWINSHKAVLETRMSAFNQLLLNSPLTHEFIYTTCQGFVSEMRKSVNSDEFARIMTHFPRFINSKDKKGIALYAIKVEEINKEIDSLNGKISDKLSIGMFKHLHENKPSEDVKAIENNTQ